MSVGSLGDGRDVEPRPRPEVDVRKTYERCLGIDGSGHDVGVEAVHHASFQEAQLAAGALCESLQHVAIGGEVVCVRQDDLSISPGGKRRRGELVEVHGRAVTHDNLSGARADQPSDPVAHCGRQVDPPGPPADEVLGPVAHGIRKPFGYRCRGSAQGVAVEVDRSALFDVELTPERRQSVGQVQSLSDVPIHAPILARLLPGARLRTTEMSHSLDEVPCDCGARGQDRDRICMPDHIGTALGSASGRRSG